MTVYHYAESGLPNVWLLTNVLVPDDDGEGDLVAIPEIDDLHSALTQHLVSYENGKRLTGPEIKYLRTELDITPRALARLLATSTYQVNRWEDGSKEIPHCEEVLLRLYLWEGVPPSVLLYMENFLLSREEWLAGLDDTAPHLGCTLNTDNQWEITRHEKPPV